MSSRSRTIEIWKEAAEDLGFEFIESYTLWDGTNSLPYIGLVPEFGSPNGALVIVGLNENHHIRTATQAGYWFSCFGGHFESYNREAFIDILNDWGWFGNPDTAPSWYTGKPWTS